MADFLLQGGQSQSWLLGNNIITITTSSGAKVGRAGLCEKCLAVARVASKKADEKSGSVPDLPATVSHPATPSGRRRHKSAAVKSLSETLPIKTVSQDDLQLFRASSKGSSAGGDAEFESSLGRAGTNSQASSLDSIRLSNVRDSSESLKSAEGMTDPGGDKREMGPSSGLETRTEKIQAVDSVLIGKHGRLAAHTM